MIEEIKKRLEADEVVELECIDKDGLARLTPYVEGLISQEPLTIESWCSDSLYLNINKRKCDQDTLSKEELQYFRIKRPAPTFDDLIDVAVQAVKDGAIHMATIRNNEISFMHENAHYKLMPAFDCKDQVDLIKSLYTETFVIKEFSDTKILKSEAKAVLGNGEEVIFSNRCGVDDALWFEYNDCHSTIIPFIALKGATVTQKRGD